MKRVISLFVALVLLLSFAACSGNYAQVDLKEPIAIPENGVIEKSVLEQIQSENAIAAFTGESDGLQYEWTIFGSDLEETRDVNLSLTLEKTEKGLKIKFAETEDFGFPALLSVHLDEKWTADSATAFDGGSAAYSVSITGSKTSILNISVNKIVSECEVIPDESKPAEPAPSPEASDPGDTASESESAGQAEPSSSSVASVPEGGAQESTASNPTDDYLSDVKNSDDRVYSGGSTGAGGSGSTAGGSTGGSGSGGRAYSDGSATDKDKYETDPVPAGKPMPVEPEDQKVDQGKTYTCTFSIECSTILNNLSDLDPNKRELVPSNGVILAPTRVTFYEGESVFDVLQRICREKGIHMESSWTPIYNSAYVEGIHNLYEFDCGELSGWMYRVNGWYPNYGCSRYQLADGEVVEWRYTCDLGKDVGCDWMG